MHHHKSKYKKLGKLNENNIEKCINLLVFIVK